MKKWLSAILLFMVLFFCPKEGYGAEPEQADISLEYGFQGNVKTGSCFPVRVKVEYTGSQTEATLVMRVPVQAEGISQASSIWMGKSEVEIGREQIYTYQTQIVLEENKPYEEVFYLELPVFEGKLQVSLEKSGELLAREEIACNFSENSFRILVGVVSDQPRGIEKLDGMQINIEQGYGMEAFVKTIQLTPQEIYPNPDALAQLDVLIADGGTAFDEEQQLALDRWSQSGGFYLERKDEDLFQLFNTLLEGKQKQDFLNYLEKMQSYMVGDTGGVHQVPITRRPSMVKYLLLLIVYMILAGPGLYLILKKKNKRNYLWAGICLLSVVFVLAIGIMGRKTNISAPFISYCGLYEQQGDVWSENIQMGIQAPYNNGYTLYLDSAYRLRPMNMSSGGQLQSGGETAENIRIQMQDSRYKITADNTAVFTQDYLELEKNRRIADSEKMQIEIQGDAHELSVKWKNHTPYTMRNVMLVMQNRAACLGNMEAGKEGYEEKIRLYSYGNGGMEYLLKDGGDFSGFPYPEYELWKLTDQTWNVFWGDGGSRAESYILGIVENPDFTFQQDSGYKIHGSALFQMPVEVSWEKDGYRWCPNLEIYGTSENGDFSSMTNLMAQKECTVDYSTGFLGKLEKLRLFSVEYDEEKYYYPFEGNIAFYNWNTLSFEEIQDWDQTIEGGELEPYVSESGVLRIRYLLEDTLYRTDSSCMLPCLEAAGKAE